MPLIEAGGLRQYYRLEGGDDSPALIFSHSLGCDHTQWDPQAAALARHFRILRYDIRGHGATGVPPGDYSIEQLAHDALALADALRIRQFAWCGLSLGGMIGQWFGANSGDRLTSLVLANTSARLDASVMETRRRMALESGLAALVPATMSRFFSPERVEANPPEVAERRRVLLATDPAGYAGCCAAIRDMNHEPPLARIKTRTLIIVGDRDPSTPWRPHGETLARRIPGAIVQRLPTAHLSNLEAPRSFTAALLNFLFPPPEEAFAGRQEGRVTLDRDRGADAGGFTRAFEDRLTRHVRGGMRQRPGLDDRTRRLLALTAAAALARWDEYRKRLREALDAGMETCDIEETLLELSVSAHQPAAETALRIAAEEMSEN